MPCPASAVVCAALVLLGRSESTMPPIHVIALRPPGVSAQAEAFVRRNPSTIYVLASTGVYRDAQAGERDALRKLASILVHEEWHIRNGPDERGAYQAQLTALAQLGAGPDTVVHHAVKRAMLHVTER